MEGSEEEAVASDANNRDFAERLLAGPASTVPAALKGQGSAALRLAVLNNAGEVLGADPGAFRRTAETIAGRGVGSGHETGGKMRFADLVDGMREPSILSFLSYAAQDGEQRKLIYVIPAASIKPFTDAALTNSLGSLQGRAYILDSTGKVVVTAGADTVGQPLTDGALARGAEKNGSGSVDGLYYAAAPVPGTSWTLSSKRRRRR